MSTTVEVVMPQMGVSVSEGTISQWLKGVGDTIEKDETLLEISTDKVDTEVPSPATGVVTSIEVVEGDTVDVGALLAVIDTGSGAASAAASAPADAEAAPAPAAQDAAPVASSEPAPVVEAPVADSAVGGEVIDVVMPQMGVSVSEGTISQWLKAVGDTIERDETLLEISTDKVDTEVPSPATGVVTSIEVAEGDTVDVGTLLAKISTGGGSAAAAAPAVSAEIPQAAPAQAPVGAAPTTPELAHAPAPAATPAPAAPTGPAVPGRFVSPVVARIAADKGIDPNTVPGSGSGGRVTKKDILAFLQGGVAPVAAPAPTAAPAAAAPAPTASAPAPAAAAPAPAAPQAPAATFQGGEQVVPFNPMRKAIARHMVESVHTSPHVTSTMEVDMTRVVRMRTALKSELEQQWGVKVTFTHFVVRALIDAIAHFPLINSEIRDQSAVVKSYVNLGIAVALDDGAGLIVPVLQHAEEKNLVGIARGINDLATRARTKKLRPDDVSGGTFTLTNPGIFGAVHGTPIINQPQVAILDTEAIIKRAVVVTDSEGADTIAIRSMMNLCMSYDHRLIDGAYAVQFLAHLKRSLETWDEASFVG